MKKLYFNLEKFENIKKNFSFFFFSNLISFLLSFIVIILFAQNYSPTSFGEFTIAQTIFFLIYAISFSNIHYYLNKTLSTNFANRRKDIASCFSITFYTSLLLYFILSIILIFIDVSRDLKIVILILNLILISEPFSIFYSELFVKGQFKNIFKIKMMQVSIFFIIKLYIIFNQINYFYIAISYVLENVFFSLLVIYFYKKNGNKLNHLLFELENTKRIFKMIFLFPLLAFALVVAMRIDILMISNILGVEYSAYYSGASRLITIILIFSSQFFQFIYPNLARLIYIRFEVEKIFRRIIFVALHLSILFLILTLFFGKYYLEIFGKEYVIAHTSFVILSVGLFFSLIINLWIQKQYLLSSYVNILFYQLTAILLNLVFNIYLINSIGMHGAALGSILSTVLAFIIVNVTNPSEVYLIFKSFSFRIQRQTAKEIFNIIFVKKKPDKVEKTND